MYFRAIRAVPFLLVAAGSFALAGCGAASGDLTGKVSSKGKALAMGQVMVVAEDKKPYYGHIGDDGSYRVSGVPLGQAKVAVSSPDPGTIGPDRGAGGRPADVEGNAASRVQALQKKDGAAPPPAPPEDRKKWVRIDEKYSDFNTSGLTTTIKPGENKFDIELK